MSLQPHSIVDLDRLAPYYRPPMLMLGATGSAVPEYPEARDYFGKWVGSEYQDLDLDGGDLRLDLNTDIGLSQTHGCVFNLGTIEHVWNAHVAWSNALRAVKVGGYFLSHGPLNGWVNHGLHMTSEPAIRAFITKNGFEIVARFTSKWKTQGEVLWLAAHKLRHIEAIDDFQPALQVYEAGQKKAVE